VTHVRTEKLPDLAESSLDAVQHYLQGGRPVVAPCTRTLTTTCLVILIIWRCFGERMSLVGMLQYHVWVQGLENVFRWDKNEVRMFI
jgi:hypothetical protein